MVTKMLFQSVKVDQKQAVFWTWGVAPTTESVVQHTLWETTRTSEVRHWILIEVAMQPRSSSTGD